MRWLGYVRPLIAAFLLLLPSTLCATADVATPLAAVVAALNSGDPSNAEALATVALALTNVSSEDRSRLLLNRGLAREKLDRRVEALDDFNAALALDALQPADKARALFDRGVAYDALGRTQEAIADYSAALALAPDFSIALNNRANAYRRDGRLEDARRDYRASLAANNPEPEYPQYGLGQIAEAQNDPAGARDWYRQALNARPGFKLASDRLATMGEVFTPVPKPPSPVVSGAWQASVTALRLPPERPAAKPALPQKMVVALAPKIAPAAYSQPDGDVPLRPAIVEAIDGTPQKLPAAHRPGRKEAGAQIQLGAWRAENDAAEGWNRLVGRAGHLLDNLTPEIVMADVPGKGRFYRLRAEPRAGTSAAEFCLQLKAQGIACIPVK
jgi:tetratricopeptide (TPR) repeat protein